MSLRLIQNQKIVEEHLIKCNECREKLNYIRNYMEENNVREQIELDYLKKIRIKTVLIAIGIIVFKKEETLSTKVYNFYEIDEMV